MHTTQPKLNIKNIAIITVITLFAIVWIGSEIRFQRYEEYAKSNSCEWQMINEVEICR